MFLPNSLHRQVSSNPSVRSENFWRDDWSLLSAPASRLLEKITGETTASTVGFMPYNKVTTPTGERFRAVRERQKTPIPLGKLGG